MGFSLIFQVENSDMQVNNERPDAAHLVVYEELNFKKGTINGWARDENSCPQKRRAHGNSN